MKKFVYPAVFYYDNETKTYCAAINDLSLFIEGDTVEEAHENASAALKIYISTSLKYGDDIPEPSSFDDVMEQYSKHIVLLVECNL